MEFTPRFRSWVRERFARSSSSCFSILGERNDLVLACAVRLMRRTETLPWRSMPSENWGSSEAGTMERPTPYLSAVAAHELMKLVRWADWEPITG